MWGWIVKTIEQALSEIARGTPQAGEAFFEALVKNLVHVLGVRYAFVAVPDNNKQPYRSLYTLACCNDGELIEPFSYELDGTPCEELQSSELCFHKDNVQALYPKDQLLVEMGVQAYLGVPLLSNQDKLLGILVVLNDEPYADNMGIARDVLRIFAQRASSELERLAEEKQRHLSEQKLRMALEAARMGTWEWDIKRGQIQLSPRAAKLYGITQAHPRISTEIYLGFVHPADRPTVQKILLDCLGGISEEFTFAHRREVASEDSPKWVELRGQVAKDKNGVPVSLVGTVTDISRRKELESQLLHAQKMEAMGRLAGGVAHDFNNLLTVIMSSGDLLAEEVRELDPRFQPPLLELIEPLQHAADRGASLTRQLLAFAHRQVTAPRLIELDRVLNDIARLLQRVLGEDIMLVVELAPELPPVYIDTNQFEQVLLNLAVNSRDAMPSGGVLSIKSRAATPDEFPLASDHEQWLMVEITDTGTGMEEEVCAQAFEPFFTTKGSGKGTGLGLATSRSIIDQFDGSIWLESTPGAGTTCSILLPAATQEETNLGLHVREFSQSSPIGDEVILIAEDDLLVRSVAVSCFNTLGYHVLEAQDGLEAIEIARDFDGEIALVLTDILMPRMNGDELARHIAEVRPTTRIVFTTGYIGDERLHELVTEQKHPIIPKPYTPNMLARRVREELDRPTMQARDL
jgi:PAS domain S-box-containing protein